MAQIIVVLLIVGVVAWYVNKYFDKRSESESPVQDSEINKRESPENAMSSPTVTEETKKTEENKYEGMNPLQLLMAVTKDLGIKIEQSEERADLFYLEYQGEKFSVVCDGKSPYITLYDINWYSAETADIDNFSLLRRAVNACNFQNLSTVLYSIDEETQQVVLSTRQVFVFEAYIPNVDDYFRSRLDDSFHQHHNFFSRMEELRKEQFAG